MRLPGVREQRRCRKWPVSRHYDGMTVNTEAVHSLQFRRLVAPLREALQWLAGFSLRGPDFDPGAVYVGFVADNGAVGLVFSPSTTDFLCRRIFTGKVLHNPVSFIRYRRCKTLTTGDIVNIAHLSIDQQTKRTSLNTSLEHYCYITLLRQLFEENVPQYRVLLSSCPWARQSYRTKSLLPTGRFVTAAVLRRRIKETYYIIPLMFLRNNCITVNIKVIPLQARCGPEDG